MALGIVYNRIPYTPYSIYVSGTIMSKSIDTPSNVTEFHNVHWKDYCVKVKGVDMGLHASYAWRMWFSGLGNDIPGADVICNDPLYGDCEVNKHMSFV